ncbi:unnamed protein product [Dovyalis caffra]|uniref:Uncharacterized protein n=1 Tax=Dovyalis caffra TaxID=77055 RepID=A0AAV1RAF0_9ROSI|nr:unnamed protein product [Dovyalis caffra]
MNTTILQFLQRIGPDFAIMISGDPIDVIIRDFSLNALSPNEKYLFRVGALEGIRILKSFLGDDSSNIRGKPIMRIWGP